MLLRDITACGIFSRSQSHPESGAQDGGPSSLEVVVPSSRVSARTTRFSSRRLRGLGHAFIRDCRSPIIGHKRGPQSFMLGPAFGMRPTVIGRNSVQGFTPKLSVVSRAWIRWYSKKSIRSLGSKPQAGIWVPFKPARSRWMGHQEICFVGMFGATFVTELASDGHASRGIGIDEWEISACHDERLAGAVLYVP